MAVKAFPSTRDHQTQGMDLRDWFAGQAIAGHMSNHSSGDLNTLLAQNAYAMADAMLEERAKAK